MEKRGQVTSFIIVGIVIIVVVAGIFYVRGIVLKSEFQKGVEEARIIPEQIKPLKESIDKCIGGVVLDGATLIGLQGGYKDIPGDFIPSVSVGNIFSNALSVFPGRGSRTVYWYYISSNSVEFNQVPSLERVESELEDYVRENIGECFTGEEVQGYAIKNSVGDDGRIKSVNIDINILNKAIEVIVDYPMSVRIKELIFDMPKYYVGVESDLGRMYALARNIFNAEEREYFFEEKVDDILVAYEDIPLSGVDFNCAPKIWYKDSVAETLKEAVARNTAFLRVKGSEYELSDIENSYFEWDVGEGDFDDISVDFSYSKEWPFFVDVVPSKNGVMESQNIVKQSDEIGGYLSTIFCLNSYNFVYDIKYPILVSLLDGDGDVFRFAMLVVIDNNQPRRDRLSDEAISGIESAPEICEQGLVDVEVNTLAPLKNDALGSLRFLDGADVSFKCITTRCDVGVSSRGVVGGRLPGCLNGLLSAEKDGYYGGKAEMSTNIDSVLGSGSQVSLVLEPIYNVDVDARIIDNVKGVREPYKSERVVVQFRGDSGYNAVFVYPDMSREKLRLIVDDYDVESFVIGESTWDIKIQGKKFEKCVKVPKGVLGVFGFKKEECFEAEMPDSFVDEVIKGGVKFRWEANRGDLIDAENSKLIFYTFSGDMPTTYDKIEDVYESIEFNAGRSDFRMPEAG